MIDTFFSYSIVGRVKDIFKTPGGRQISPSQVEDVLLSEPQGLVTDAIVAGVMPRSRSKDELKGEVPRAWIVLSDEGKKLGADVVIKELEVWLRNRLSNHKWLHGGIEVVDEVCMAVVLKVFFFSFYNSMFWM
jgi:acyl-CoA synthetase (AMP-forming)/AMP-acid ligase II